MTTTTRLTPPLKWHGGKHYLAARIVGLMPPHLNYVEPFAGGLSVLLAKDPEGVSEVVNDLDGPLTNFWRVLQNPDRFERFRRRIEAVPFSEVQWRAAEPDPSSFDPVANAVAFFVRCRQSLAGRGDAFTGITRTRTRRGMNNEVSAWLSAVDGLPAVHERLRRVLVLNRDALDVIRDFDGRDTLFYLDPPYVPDVRTAPKVYPHEMSSDQHAKLLAVVKRCKGKVMISGYGNAVYDGELKRWKRHAFDLPNHAASGGKKRRVVECVWANF